MKKYIFLLLIFSLNAFSYTPCDKDTGMADIYPCENIDLLSRVDINDMGGSSGDSVSDIWGWTDSETGKEYAITGLSSGTTFVDVSDPKKPIYLGRLQAATGNSIWRDIKTYKDHAYIVSEASGHGMQVFDLTQLRDVSNPPVEFTATNRYTEFGSSHNIVINEETGFAYSVGTGTCGAGLHMINIQDPVNPINAGCFGEDGYTHDAQCVTYIGPDSQYNGKEICFNANEDTITIVDVTNKDAPIQISRSGYSNSQYSHQGWLTDDMRYYLMNDELDEQRNGHKTRTYIWDMLDLDTPQLLGFYNGPKDSIDHNVYIKGNRAYLTNYTSGLRIVDITDIGTGQLWEVASFDGYPDDDSATFNGAWSNYPYFESDNIIMSDFSSGLFILEPNICPVLTATQNVTTTAIGDNSIQIDWDQDITDKESYNVYRSEGGCEVDDFIKIADSITDNTFIDNNVSGQVPIGYKISKSGSNENCESERSICIETQTTGQCTAAPIFVGIKTVNSSNTSVCGVDIAWDNATSYCQSSLKYDVFKSSDPTFLPDNSNKVASNISTNQWHDSVVYDKQEYFYLVRATDNDNNNQEQNIRKLSTRVYGTFIDGTWQNGAEVGDDSFEQANRHVGWEISSDRKKSGERSFWSQANDNTCNNLTTQTIILSADEPSELSFWTAYDIHNRWDGGVVEISNDKSLWDTPDLNPNYPDTFKANTNACSYVADTPAFTGTNLTWKKHSMDLSAYKGQEINIRWNYSTNSSYTGEGWFVDDIKVTHAQIPEQCETQIQAPATIQAGLWYDKSRSGHGFSIEAVNDSGLYFTVFYSYQDDGTPEWYTSLSTLEDGVLNINLEDGTLRRFIYDYSIDPVGNGAPNVPDDSVGTNVLSIDFNNEIAVNSDACIDANNVEENLALASWQLGQQQGSWCVQPLIEESSYPKTDFGGIWWTGSDDTGWGLSLAFTGDTIIVIIYYYDNQGNPRWVLGQSAGFQVGQEINVDMKQFQGFARDADPIATTNTSAGTIKLTLNSNTQDLTTDGLMTLDINYQGKDNTEHWIRQDMPVTNFTKQH